MKYRKLDANDDYTFGQNDGNFYYNLDACAQAVYTRMNLYLGEFWRDLNDGLPLFQRILGSYGSLSNLETIDGIMQQRILGTENVVDIFSFSSAFDREARQYSFQTKVQTSYSSQLINYQGAI